MRGIRLRAGYATRDSLASANAMAFQPAQELTQKTKTPHVYGIEMHIFEKFGKYSRILDQFVLIFLWQLTARSGNYHFLMKVQLRNKRHYFPPTFSKI